MSSGIRIVTSIQTTVCTVVVWGPDVVLTVHLAQQFTNVWTSVCLPPLFALKKRKKEKICLFLIVCVTQCVHMCLVRCLYVVQVSEEARGF